MCYIFLALDNQWHLENNLAQEFFSLNFYHFIILITFIFSWKPSRPLCVHLGFRSYQRLLFPAPIYEFVQQEHVSEQFSQPIELIVLSLWFHNIYGYFEELNISAVFWANSFKNGFCTQKLNFKKPPSLLSLD